MDWRNPRLLVVGALPSAELIPCLEKEGYQVSRAATVATALALHRCFAINLLIVHAQETQYPTPVGGQIDLLPDFEIRSVIRELRAGCGDLSILVLIGADEDVVSILEAGADDVMMYAAGQSSIAARVRAQHPARDGAGR